MQDNTTTRRSLITGLGATAAAAGLARTSIDKLWYNQAPECIIY